MSEHFEVAGKPVWIPDGLPKQLLPPDIDVRMSFDELVDLSEEDFCRIYYERSGRYLGIFDSREEADRADPYRFSRQYIPGGKLPWEK